MTKFYPLLLTSLSMCASSWLPGETINQTFSMGGTASWLDGAFFSDGLPAHAGDDYLLDTAGFQIRPPVIGDATFPGDSLTIDNGARFTIKLPNHSMGDTPVDATFTFTRLVFGDAELRHGGNTNFGRATIAGGMEIIGDLKINTGQWERPIQIDSLVSGSGNITVEQAAGNADGRGIVSFTNSSNTFNGSISVLSTGTLDFDYDADTLHHLSIDGVLILDQALAVRSLTILGTTVDAGTYSAAELIASYPDALDPASTGSIRVVAPITQVFSMGGSASWLDGAFFSDGLPAHAGDDYLLDTAGFQIRTPQTGDATFPGDSLTIDNGAKFTIKLPNHTSEEPPVDATFTFTRLVFGDAGLFHGGNTNFGRATFAGGMEIVGDLTINTNQWERPIQIDSLVSGSGNVTIEQGSGNADGSGIVSFTNSNNTFDGTITVETTGTLDFDYDADTISHLELDGVLVLDQMLTVDTLSVMGTTLEPGTYTADFLNAAFPSHFIILDGGSITVTSEVDPTWAGLSIVDGWVTTTGFGPLYVGDIPWVYASEKSSWMYLPPVYYSDSGFWNYMIPVHQD